MKELAGNPIDDNSYEYMVLRGLRALLGDEKAQRSMVALQSGSPAASEQVMSEAQARYDALSPEQKEAPQKVLEQIAASSTMLRFKIMGRQAPKRIIKTIPKVPKFIFTSIPKLLKSIFLKR